MSERPRRMNPPHREEEDESTIDAALNALSIASSNSISPLKQAQKEITILAAASRTNPYLRARLATPNILNPVLNTIEHFLQANDTATAAEALRCVGNALIDNDTARALVVEMGSSAWAKACLRQNDAEVTGTSVKVLYNLCLDYEPAQQWSYAEQLQSDIISILGSGQGVELGGVERVLGIELLFWITNRRPQASEEGSESEVEISRRVSQTTLQYLLRLPFLWVETLDVEDFATVLEICLTYLRDPVVQKQVLEYQYVRYVWRMLSDNETRILQLEAGDRGEEGAEEVKLLVPLSLSLIWILSDLAAASVNGVRIDDTFVESIAEAIMLLGAGEDEGPDHPAVYLARQGRLVDVEGVVSRISVPRRPRILSAACLILGNVIWQQEPQQWNHLLKLRVPLWSTLARSATQDAELLHSAAGLLVQLARGSMADREIMANDMNATAALERLCGHETPQLKQDGIRLLRALGKECPANQARWAELAKEVFDTAAKGTEVTDASDDAE